MATKEDIAWLAGILDGEGCIMLHLQPKSGYHLCRVQITNTDEGILDEVERILGEWLIFYLRREQPNNGKPCYVIAIGRRLEAKFLLEQLMPYLRSVKKKKAQQFIDFVRTYKRNPTERGCAKKVVQYSYL